VREWGDHIRAQRVIVKPRIAVGPDGASWADDAIRRGGGETVSIDDHPDGLIWIQFQAAQNLKNYLHAHPGIGWVQLPLAGVEDVFAAGIITHDQQWTSAKGAYAEPVAEHALMLALAGLRQLPTRARARSWGKPAAETLFDEPVTIVGAGGITVELLKLLAPFRAHVTVVRPRPVPLEGAELTVASEHLHDALASARVVFLAPALTAQTHHMIGRAELAVMRGDAWLVNVGRGGLVDTDALVDALRNGSIGGAALDVTDPEPLPTGHPLWRLKNCLITPHTADTKAMVFPLLAKRISENVRRLGAGEELLGLVDADLGY
jgi:phosphoglycerate dehydrogenase-like enzyme